jgi:vitamin K-dependent gamma-carboxylase
MLSKFLTLYLQAMNSFTYLRQSIDNVQLVLFRILFGFLMFAEAVGALVTGWVKETFVEPSLTFHFIGFGFLQALVGGPQMYIVYGCLGVAALAVMLGWRYRWAAFTVAVLWSASYFNQKSHYNNHYYLMVLISWMMVFLPTHTAASLDVRQSRVEQRNYAPAWIVWILPALVAVVYFYAAIAKIYPDWLQAIPVSIWFRAESFETPFWGPDFAVRLRDIFHHSITHYFFSYAGIFFDLLVIPAFLWKRTRTIALLASLGFHLMNSAIFQIGVFPYFALSFVIFFYPRSAVRKRFFPASAPVEEDKLPTLSQYRLLSKFALLFMIWQFLLPLRHWLIPGDVLWTEEGHRLSWRMMLRTKSTYGGFTAENKLTGERVYINNQDFLSRQQERSFKSKPDMVWQFAQVIKRHYQEKEGWQQVAVYADINVSVNGSPYYPFTNPDFDLASVSWKYFGHQPWLLEPPKD